MIITKSQVLQISFFLILAFTLSSTEQIKDKLIGANGNLYDIRGGYPLESFYDQNPGIRPQSEVLSTALWRGYVSYYKLSNKALYLVYTHYPDTGSSYEIRRLPEEKKLAEIPVKSLRVASWYTGAIALSLNEKNDEDKWLLLEFEIENGMVTDIYKTTFPTDLYVLLPSDENKE